MATKPTTSLSAEAEENSLPLGTDEENLGDGNGEEQNDAAASIGNYEDEHVDVIIGNALAAHIQDAIASALAPVMAEIAVLHALQLELAEALSNQSKTTDKRVSALEEDDVTRTRRIIADLPSHTVDSSRQRPASKQNQNGSGAPSLEQKAKASGALADY